MVDKMDSALQAVYEAQEYCDCGHRSGQHHSWTGKCDLCDCAKFEYFGGEFDLNRKQVMKPEK